MRFLNWYLGPLKKYVVIQGRASRKEYWLFTLFNTFVWLNNGQSPSSIGIAYIFATFIPMVTVGVRRLHDTNRSGMWWLLLMVPIGNLIVSIWLVIKGTEGDNDYGPDPLSRSKSQTPTNTRATANAREAYCASCGVTLASAAFPCGSCGSTHVVFRDRVITPSSFCTTCETPLAEGAAFCSRCGSQDPS